MNVYVYERDKNFWNTNPNIISNVEFCLIACNCFSRRHQQGIPVSVQKRYMYAYFL
jgi:hypothetical protein